MTARELLQRIRETGGSVRIVSDNALWANSVPKSLIPELTRLKSEVSDLLCEEERRRVRVCPECQAEFETPNACADHMRFECPLWCPDCNKFIMRNGVCPGCDLKHLKPGVIAQRRDENFRRLNSRFNLKSVGWKRMREITDGQPWQLLPTRRSPATSRGARRTQRPELWASRARGPR